MRFPSLLLAGVIAGTLPASAFADRGALTLDVGGGIAVEGVAAPYVSGGTRLWGFDPAVQLALRYAVTHVFEITVDGVFTTPSVWYHNAAVVSQGGASYTGTLQHKLYRVGALVGVRAVFGLTWRPFVQLQVGWSHRSFYGFRHIDDQEPGLAQDYYLSLPPVSRESFVAAASGGIQWCGDNLCVSLAPRLEWLVGANPMPVISIPVSIGWSFYL
jgi:hypothetical protein